MARRRESSKVIPLRQPGARTPSVERVAAIDIGSNSIRAIVADVDSSGAIRVIDELKDAPRLGAGLETSGMLDPAAMRRASDAVLRMATLARAHGAGRVEAVATSAVRDASNADEFVELVRADAGLPVRVLEGEDEARLGYRSALAHFDLGVGRWAVVDIGGGSLELALSADGLVDRLVSLPLGALRLTERFLGAECERRDVRALRRHVREALRVRLPARDWRGAKIIGSGGTFTNLAGMFRARQEIVTAQTIHGTRVSRVDLEHILDALQDTTLAERQRFPGLNMARADIIVAGLAVVAEVMARLDAHELTVSGYGIREGLLLETARVMPAIANPGEARGRSVRRLAEACHYEEPHSRHVQQLALQLFDSLGERLGCVPADRQTLADAALLHDIGYHISYDKHHKHSYYLILHAELLGMSPSEQVVVANVARYHRGTSPKKKQGNFGALDKESRKRIKRLAAILRVADGFDRGHVRNVERVKVRWGERSLRLTPVPRESGQSLRLELWGANRKSDLLADLAGIPVEIVSPGGGVVGVDDLPAALRAESGD
jgi:exopolyphosphatase/guanosine-5'-triphosphate,3'-diphosphate pyrophosphatase